MLFGKKQPTHSKKPTDEDWASWLCSRGFDIADILEQGLARETCTEYLRPFRRASKLFRFYVTRSDDRQQYTMYTDETDGFVMHARFVSPTRVIFLPYHPDDALFNVDEPIFAMEATPAPDDSGRKWTVYTHSCDVCHYKGFQQQCCCIPQRGSDGKPADYSKQEVVHMQHKMQTIGDGVFNSMESFIPGLYTDGSRVVWCPQEGYPPLGSLDPEGSHHPHCIRVKTKEPRWNPDVECLVLEFKGRTIQPSAKNFQLSLTKKPEYIIMQFGKVSNNVFILDFRYPLSIIQAFSLALSTYHWK